MRWNIFRPFWCIFAAYAAIDAFDAETHSLPMPAPAHLSGSPNPFGLDTGPPNPFGLPRSPNPKGTFVRFCATKVLFLQGVHVCTACKNSSFCTVLRYKKLLAQAVHRCTPWANSFLLHGFARFAHASAGLTLVRPTGTGGSFLSTGLLNGP